MNEKSKKLVVALGVPVVKVIVGLALCCVLMTCKGQASTPVFLGLGHDSKSVETVPPAPPVKKALPVKERADIRVDAAGNSYELNVWDGQKKPLPLPNLYPDDDGLLVSGAREIESASRMIWGIVERYWLLVLMAVIFKLREYERRRDGVAGSVRARIAAMIAPRSTNGVPAADAGATQTGKAPAVVKWSET
jgi:hypothetical protein